VKQDRVNDHFNAIEFIEELMEEERAGVKKEKKKVAEVSVYNLEFDIPMCIQNKLRDEKIE
jgi:hypothetical protein